MVFAGIDVGTSGVRGVAVRATGEVVASEARPLPPERCPSGTHEQDPAGWWQTLSAVTQALARAVPGPEIAGVAVTSTSGSLVVAGAEGEPLRPAILYDDPRAGATPARLNASYSLSKAVWVRETEPRVWERMRYLLHPADWLSGRLTGEYGVADYSNVLKLGWDLEQECWTEAVRRAEIPAAALPRVVAPGAPVGRVCPPAAAETGLPAGTPVLAGATDGLACLLSSGAASVGDANTTLGTTLVWKVLSSRSPFPSEAIYFHKHPSGAWAPGAASNTGPGCIRYQGPDPESANREAARCLPTPVLCYLLAGRGERFPFRSPQASGFVEGGAASPAEWLAAQLQAVAFTERWGYEILEAHGIQVGDAIYSAGAAAQSPVLSQLRADVLGRAVLRCAHPSGAFGAAILAAAGRGFGGDTSAAVRSMTRVEACCHPRRDLSARYAELYAAFRQACAGRGYGS